MDRFFIVIALTVVIHMISTLAYSVRVAGVRTQRLLTAFSLYNVIYLLASVSNTVQAPLLTSIVEHGIKAVAMQAGNIIPVEQLVYHDAYREQLASLAEQIRLVIIAAMLGTLLGTALIPAFVNIFVRVIHLFEETGSASRAFLELPFSCFPWRESHARLQFSSGNWFKPLLRQKITIPKNFLLINIIVTGFYTSGVLSALYAGAMFPDFRTTATTLASFVSGVATVLGALVVEPTASSITDEAQRGDRDEAEVIQMTFYLAFTRLLGTIFAQVLFLPCAYLIKFIAQLLA